MITTIVDSREIKLKDTVFLTRLSKLYRNSFLAKADSLLKDSIFLHSNRETSIVGYNTLASSVYKIQFPFKPLGWTSDFEHIFLAEQIVTLDSMIGSFEKETTNQIAIVTYPLYQPHYFFSNIAV